MTITDEIYSGKGIYGLRGITIKNDKNEVCYKAHLTGVFVNMETGTPIKLTDEIINDPEINENKIDMDIMSPLVVKSGQEYDLSLKINKPKGVARTLRATPFYVNGRVPMDVFVDAFMASANGIDTTLTQAWLEEWQQIQATVRKVAPSLEGFAIDSTLLANLLKEGKYVVHHSASFNKHYHPHYRIIRKDFFEETILPRLK